MALDERSRHELYLRLEETLGPEAASTLMEYLPPVGWADVTTKRDLDALEQRLDMRFEHVEERLQLRMDALEHKLIAAFRGEIQTAVTAQGRQLAISLVGTAGAFSALAFAVAKLT